MMCASLAGVLCLSFSFSFGGFYVPTNKHSQKRLLSLFNQLPFFHFERERETFSTEGCRNGCCSLKESKETTYSSRQRDLKDSRDKRRKQKSSENKDA
jgi:hypothetical protein